MSNLNKIRQMVLEAARSELKVYIEQIWMNANNGHTKEEFCVALKDARTPLEIHGTVNYGFDSLDTAALLFGGIYSEDECEEEPTIVEPKMELEISISLPDRINHMDDPLELMEGIHSVLGLKPCIIEEVRTAPTGPNTSHKYAVTWYWAIDEERLGTFKDYKHYFIRTKKALEYLTLRFGQKAIKT
ncbi:hypothetical protein LCGC14_1581300 [marine sediment metagenome]|uniref:Uncharacterized protein n=1 Tax=marine sediment metagenome TaxID=412755 RepID=A0A0F9IGZ6_9ZZZZ